MLRILQKLSSKTYRLKKYFWNIFPWNHNILSILFPAIAIGIRMLIVHVLPLVTFVSDLNRPACSYSNETNVTDSSKNVRDSIWENGVSRYLQWIHFFLDRGQCLSTCPRIGSLREGLFYQSINSVSLKRDREKCKK